jgi:hypothetical protein
MWPKLVAYKLQEIFCIIGYPKIFHTDNGKEFTAKIVLQFLCHLNPNILTVACQPCCPSDQGSFESMNKLVKSVIGSVLTERRLMSENPNWTEIFVGLASAINTQHGHVKDDVLSFQAVYGQGHDHRVLCTKEEKR